MKYHGSPTGLVGPRLTEGSPIGPTTLWGGTNGTNQAESYLWNHERRCANGADELSYVQREEVHAMSLHKKGMGWT
jgi:hypothetical protein